MNNSGKSTETPLSGGVVTYGYDNAGQLNSEMKSGAYSIGYTYDNAGNRLTKTLNGVTDTYTYDSTNKLSGVTGSVNKSYTYDLAGNVKTVTSGSVVTSLTWDGDSRLTAVNGGGVSNTYSYNGLGQRSGKVDSTGTFNFTRNSDSIDAPVVSDGAARYVQGSTGLLSEVRGGTSKYYHADALGSTRAITNTSGVVTDTKATDAFGITYSAGTTGSTPTPFGFVGAQGYQSDSDTGLMLLGHRYYDASVGRFLSRDPIQDGNNWYVYCGNDPVNGVDPTGYTIQTVLNPDGSVSIRITSPIGGGGTGTITVGTGAPGGTGPTGTIGIGGPLPGGGTGTITVTGPLGNPGSGTGTIGIGGPLPGGGTGTITVTGPLGNPGSGTGTIGIGGPLPGGGTGTITVTGPLGNPGSGTGTIGIGGPLPGGGTGTITVTSPLSGRNMKVGIGLKTNF